jgi:hypothetical protein
MSAGESRFVLRSGYAGEVAPPFGIRSGMKPMFERMLGGGADPKAADLCFLVVRLYAQPPACVVKKSRSQRA